MMMMMKAILLAVSLLAIVLQCNSLQTVFSKRWTFPVLDRINSVSSETSSPFIPHGDLQTPLKVNPMVVNHRRMLIQTSLSFLTAVPAALAFADPSTATSATNYFTFQDVDCGFEIKIPSSWDKSVQALADRRNIILFIEPNSVKSDEDKTLLFVAYTPVRDDFTSLSSFGSVDQVAQMTILPKSTLAGQEGVEGSMLLAESKGNAYYFDYTTKVTGQPMRHFRTIFALIQGATGGAGSVLLTITAQTPESKYPIVQPIFDDIIGSYRRITPGTK